MVIDSKFPRPSDPNFEGVSPPMIYIREITQWEYKCISCSYNKKGLPGESELNELGSEGWELVCLYHCGHEVHFYFKRLKNGW